MKTLKKNKDNFFICEECDRLFKSKTSLCSHIKQSHNNTKDYFDKWIKEKNDDKCKICNKITKFISIGYGYNNCCSKKCSNKYRDINKKKSTFKKYGVESIFNSKKIMFKIKKIFNKKYGVNNAFESKEIREKGKQTKIKKYGNKNYNNQEKNKQTCLEKYGVENVFQVEEIKDKCKKTKKEKYNDEKYINQEKGKQTYLKKWGVEYPMQNKEIFEKQQKASFKAKKYKDTDLFYRGSLEFDFLETYLLSIPEIINAPTVKYYFKGSYHNYFPDFYIPSLNLIIEIKALYYYEKYKAMCDAKAKGTIKKGFNYIMIVDMDYKNINNNF